MFKESKIKELRKEVRELRQQILDIHVLHVRLAKSNIDLCEGQIKLSKLFSDGLMAIRDKE